MKDRYYGKQSLIKSFKIHDSFYKVLYLAIFGISAIFGSQSLKAQNIVSDSTEVKFLQSRSVLNTALDKNKPNLDRMLRVLKERKDSADYYRLRNIKVIGSASPEGSVKINRTLSQKRANSIFNYIGERIPLDYSLTKFEFLGRDWKGLYNMVHSDSAVPYRQEVLAILESVNGLDTVTSFESDKTLNKLKSLHNGVPYRYLYYHLFPSLRNSKLFVEYDFLQPTHEIVDSLPETPQIVVTDSILLIEDEFIPQPIIPAGSARSFYMGLKTNLLSDALLLPNIGVEFYLGKNWSVVGNWTYGWWDKNKTHWYWRGYGGDIAVRKWFGHAAEEKPLTGHHLGVYGGVLTYDFEAGGKGYMGGRPGHNLWNRCLFTAGVEYGYSLPIARHFNLDFTLGIGYIGGKIVKYKPQGDKYIWESTRNFKGVLPTKAEISLVWLIGSGNYNK